MSVVDSHSARELTPQEQKAREEMCYGLEENIRRCIAQGREALWTLAEQLYLFNEEHGWSALGYENQETWLAQPEIGMTRIQYFRLVRKWKELVVNRQLPMGDLVELEPSKVDIVMSAIENDVKPLSEIISDVKMLGARDLIDEYKGHRSNGASGSGSTEDGDHSPSAVDDVVEGQESTELSEEERERHEQLERATVAAATVDSWLEMGGDRRKAKRSWAKFLTMHPVFAAIETVGSYVEGSESAPERSEAREAWREVTETFSLYFDV